MLLEGYAWIQRLSLQDGLNDGWMEAYATSTGMAGREIDVEVLIHNYLTPFLPPSLSISLSLALSLSLPLSLRPSVHPSAR